MQNVSSEVQAFEVAKKPAKFNVNKLHAALCMAASAAVSIAIIVWIVKTIL